MHNVILECFKACIFIVSFFFSHILFSFLLFLQWPHLEQWGCKPSIALHRKSNCFMLHMFPRLWNSVKVHTRSLILFFFLLCAIKPESIPYSERSCELPRHTWPASSDTAQGYCPRSLTLLVQRGLSSCWAPPAGLHCCLSVQCLGWKKNPEWEWNTNLCHQDTWIIFKELYIILRVAEVTPYIWEVWNRKRFNTAKE